MMTKLTVRALPTNDTGRQLVRLNINHRVGIPRYGLAQLMNFKNAKSVKVLVLGHDDDDAIFMLTTSGKPSVYQGWRTRILYPESRIVW
jgi:hypothetical protein